MVRRELSAATATVAAALLFVILAHVLDWQTPRAAEGRAGARLRDRGGAVSPSRSVSILDDARYGGPGLRSSARGSASPAFTPIAVCAMGTTFEVQHNDDGQKQIATLGDGAYVHFAWTQLSVIPEDPGSGARMVAYNAYSTTEGLLQGDCGYVLSGAGGSPALAHAGFVTLDVDRDDLAHVAFHQRNEDAQAEDPPGAHTNWMFDQALPGLTLFMEEELPTGGLPDAIWPHLAIDRTGGLSVSGEEIYHIAARPFGTVEGAIQYWRRDGEGMGTWQGPVCIDVEDDMVNHHVAVDPTSGRVAIIYGRGSGDPGDLVQILYVESLNNGQDWIDQAAIEPPGTCVGPLVNGGRQFVTTYSSDPDGPQGGPECTGAFDADGRLHVVWVEQATITATGACRLQHWDDATGVTRTIAEALDFANAGAHRIRDRWLSYPQIGFGDGNTLCTNGPFNPGPAGPTSNYGYMYVTYEQAGGPTAAEANDASAAGFQNLEIYLAVSNDRGYTWSPPSNLTQTQTPSCDGTPGNECASEREPSIAALVNDTLHILYIHDLDAGDVFFGNGTWTFNPVMYLRIPGGDTPPVCPDIGPSFAAQLSNQHPGCLYTAPFSPPGMQDEILTVRNLGSDVLTGNITVNPPSATWLQVASSGFSIAPGDLDELIDVTFNAGDPSITGEGLYQATIEIDHNDPTKVSPYLIPVTFSVRPPVSAEFSAAPTNGYLPLTVFFTPASEHAGFDYLWTFGDGDSSMLPAPVHTYNSPTTFDVSLSVAEGTPECDLNASEVKPDYIAVQTHRARFAADPKAGQAPLTVQFTDQSEGTPDSWFWEFGCGHTSTLQDPSHEYTQIGVFDVSLHATWGAESDDAVKLGLIRTTGAAEADLAPEVWADRISPGFDFTLWTAWTNLGGIVADNCVLVVELPAESDFVTVDLARAYFATGTYDGYTQVGKTVTISLLSIDPTQPYGGYIPIVAHLPEGVPCNSELLASASLSTTSTETELSNNTQVADLVAVCSWDPNDKTALPPGDGFDKTIAPGTRLTYRIDFENKAEATASAIYVLVIDTLDANLDWSTFVEGPSTHRDPCELTRDPVTGVITYFCDSIMLPPNVTPPEGEGYFTYSIVPKAGLANGTQILNRAHIRFDFNPYISAPEDGPLVRTVFQACICPFQSDFDEDGFLTALDLSEMIDILFVGHPDVQDPVCPSPRADFDCDGFSTALDLGNLIDHLFAGGDGPCDPCAVPPGQ